jgi:hypothetical protein
MRKSPCYPDIVPFILANVTETDALSAKDVFTKVAAILEKIFVCPVYRRTMAG